MSFHKLQKDVNFDNLTVNNTQQIPLLNKLPSVNVPGKLVALRDSNKVSLYISTVNSWKLISDTVSSTVNTVFPLDGNGTAINPVSLKDGLAAGQTLIWDGSEWMLDTASSTVNTVSPLDGNGTAINPVSLKDGTVVGQTLIWDGSEWMLDTISNTTEIITSAQTVIDPNIDISYIDEPTNKQLSLGTPTTSTGFTKKIVNLSESTSLWETLESGLNGNCFALAVDSIGNVYVGGDFTQAGGAPASRIAKWIPATNTWESLEDGITIGSSVRALAIDNSDNVYVGGNFTEVDNVPANNIAKWNPALSSWEALSSGLGDDCLALAIDSNDNVYAGGDFTLAGGDPANFIAKWISATSTWETLGAGLDNPCQALAVDSSDNVYVGGSFSSPANNIAKWIPSTDIWEPLGAGLDGICVTLAVDSNDNVYVGGGFSTPENSIAKWISATNMWEPLGSGINGGCAALAIDTSNDNVYVGGTFTLAGDFSANDIAKWNPSTSTWQPLGSGLNNNCRAVAVDTSNNVYAGGSFIFAGGVPANRIAKWIAPFFIITDNHVRLGDMLTNEIVLSSNTTLLLNWLGAPSNNWVVESDGLKTILKANNDADNNSITNLNSLSFNTGFFVSPISTTAATSPTLIYDVGTGEIQRSISSIKYKEQVQDLDANTSTIYQVQPRTFISKLDKKSYIGYIAEELEQVDTKFTWKNKDGTPEGIEWFNMLVYTIKELGEKNKEIKELKQLVLELKEKVDKL